MNETRTARIEHLEDELRRSGLDHGAILESLPDNPLTRVAALATILELDALKAMNNDIPLTALIAERDERRNLIPEADAAFEAQGEPFPIDPEER